jgi:hypothetical protein
MGGLGIGGLGPGKGHDTGRLGMDGLGLGEGHDTGRLGMGGYDTSELCPNVTGTH